MNDALAGQAGTFEWAGVRSELMFRIDVMPFGEDDEITHAVADVPRHRRRARRCSSRSRSSASSCPRCSRSSASASASPTPAAACCRFDGCEIDDELHPLEWSEHFGLRHPDGTPFGPHEAPLLRALRGEQVRDVEVHVETAEGRRALLESGGPVMAADGRRLGAVVVNADLTAFREAEGRLRRSEERHRRVLESMSDCVFETDETRALDASERDLDRRDRLRRRGLPRPAGVGVRPPRGPLRARARLRAAAERRARRAAPLRTAS